MGARLASPCSALEDEPVLDEDGQVAGRIARIVIDLATGRVTHAIIGSGGVLGLGESHRTVAWSHLRADPECGFVLPRFPEARGAVS